MYVLEKAKEYIAEQINKALGEEFVQASSLVYPPTSDMGDLSLAGFELAKKLKQTPGETVAELVEKIEMDDIITGVKVAGPYLNFTISKKYLVESVIKEIFKLEGKYGENETGQEQGVMIEYSNGNTHKEYHIGHLRNISYGDAVNKILLANGHKSIPVSYINDFGIHVAKTVWNYLTNKEKWSQRLEDKGYLLGKIYVEANTREKEEATAKQMIQLTMKKIEARKGDEYKNWEETRKWSIEYFDKIYKELGVRFKKTYYESEYIDEGKKQVDKLLEKGILKKSDGAIIADLEGEGLGILVVVRSDGTALYPVADIPLALEKFKKFKISRSIYVVDIRQGLYLKQLAAIIKKMGYEQEIFHLGYDFVKLPSGMMASRSGNVITYQELKEKMFKKIIAETKERHADWEEKKVEEVAKKIAIGAMKFEMIKVNPKNIIVFDIDKALQSEGYTSAYLQYTYARIQSVIRKSKVEGPKSKVFDSEKLSEEKERGLILKMAKYPEAVLVAGENYDPAEIAKYLFELAQNLNDYYHAVPVLKAEEDIKKARLALLSAVSQVLKNGLTLLGVEVLEEM